MGFVLKSKREKWQERKRYVEKNLIKEKKDTSVCMKWMLTFGQYSNIACLCVGVSVCVIVIISEIQDEHNRFQ